MKLSEFVFKVNKPCLFKNILKRSDESNSAAGWTLDELSDELGDERLLFRMGLKQKENCKLQELRSFWNTKVHRRLCFWAACTGTVQFENECSYVDATLGEFLNWTRRSKPTVVENGDHGKCESKKLRLEHLNGDAEQHFGQFNPDDHWAYADYKYMIDFLDSENKILDENVTSRAELLSFGLGFLKKKAAPV